MGVGDWLRGLFGSGSKQVEAPRAAPPVAAPAPPPTPSREQVRQSEGQAARERRIAEAAASSVELAPSPLRCPSCRRWAFKAKASAPQCPICGKTALSRVDPATGERRFMTQDEADHAAAEQKRLDAEAARRKAEQREARRLAIRAQFDAWLRTDPEVAAIRAELGELTASDLEDLRPVHEETSETGNPLAQETIWGSAFARWAPRLFAEGRPFAWALRRARSRELSRLHAPEILVEARPDACAACKALDGQPVEREAALRDPPLPHPACTHEAGAHGGFCRCTYREVRGEVVEEELARSGNKRQEREGDGAAWREFLGESTGARSGKVRR